MDRPYLKLGIIFLFILSINVFGTVHIIKFGGTVGSNYSPNILAVIVGDTVQWQGSFSFHPLSSREIPVGANNFSCSIGSVFNYVIDVPGNYSYQCDAHHLDGMVGSFSASGTTGIREQNSKVLVYQLEQNYPNPFNPSTIINYQIPKAGNVTIKVYNILGKEISSLVNNFQNEGQHSVAFNSSELSSGIYFYELKTNGYSSIRKMILAK